MLQNKLNVNKNQYENKSTVAVMNFLYLHFKQLFLLQNNSFYLLAFQQINGDLKMKNDVSSKNINSTTLNRSKWLKYF